MKFEFDPSDSKQVESVLKMLKADRPDLWTKINQIPIGIPLWEVLKFELATKIFLKRNNLSTVEDLNRLTKNKVTKLIMSPKAPYIIDNIERTLGAPPWKTKN